jgi:hypothetical protein
MGADWQSYCQSAPTGYLPTGLAAQSPLPKACSSLLLEFIRHDRQQRSE